MPLTVTSHTLISLAITTASPKVAMATSAQFAATATYSDASTYDVTRLVTWISENRTVAEISSAPRSNGLAWALTSGTSKISAIFRGISASAPFEVTNATVTSVKVTPELSNVRLGSDLQYTATAKFSDTTEQDVTSLVGWFVSEETYAIVSNAADSRGLAIPVFAPTPGPGSTDITGMFPVLGGGVGGAARLDVFP
jgi:hypothetical protein